MNHKCQGLFKAAFHAGVFITLINADVHAAPALRPLLQTLTFLHSYRNTEQPVGAFPQRPPPPPTGFYSREHDPITAGTQRGWCRRSCSAKLWPVICNAPLETSPCTQNTEDENDDKQEQQMILCASGSSFCNIRQDNAASCRVIRAGDTPCTCIEQQDQGRLAGKRLCADTFWSLDGTVPEMEASYLVRAESRLPWSLCYCDFPSLCARVINATLMCWSCRFGDFMRPPIQVWQALPKRLSKGRWMAGECHIWTSSTESPFLWRQKVGKAVRSWSGLTFPCLCLVMQQPRRREVLQQAAALWDLKKKKRAGDENRKISIIFLKLKSTWQLFVPQVE